jgi:4-hydroxy-tetrahydrodipicolinate synthase
MITPTTGVENIDTETLRDFTDFLVQGGVDGLFPIGTTGEFPSLGREQRRGVIETVVDHSADLPVLAGCGGTAVSAVRQYVADAADVGADAAVVVTPYYQDASQEGLRRFYEAIADDSALPIYLYNIPQFTGNNLAPETIAMLAEHTNVAGLKDSSGDFTYFLDLLEVTPDSFDVFQGIPMYSIMSLEHGADGLIAGSANVFPRAVSELYNAYENGDDERARQQFSRVVLPVLQSTRSMPTISALRYLSAKAGQDLGDPLPPLAELDRSQREKLDDLYQVVSATELTTASD